MLRKAAATLAVAAATILLLQCSRDKTTSPQTAPLGEPVKIQLGQQVVFGAEEIRVTFKSVNFDERCVGATDCIWDGLAEATFSLRTAEGQIDNLELVITGQPAAENQFARSRQSLGYRLILGDLQPVGAGESKDATPTATVIVKAGDLDSPSHTESVVFVDLPNESVLGRDVVINRAGLRGDTLMLQTQTNGSCLLHYFALFAPRALSGANGDELNLYVKHISRIPTCIGTVNQEVKFDISALRQFLTDELQEIQLHIFGCSNALASGPQHLLFPYGNYINRPPVLESIGLQQFKVDVEKRFAIVASDPDGPRPAITITGMPQNSRIERVFDTTYFVFQPAESQLGWHSIFVAASDGREADTERVALHVTQSGTNAPPVLIVPRDTTISEGDSLGLEIIATDADSDPVTVEVQGLPRNAQFGKASGDGYRLYLQPAFDQAGFYALLFLASDGIDIDTALLFITVTNSDRPPVIQAPAGVNRVRCGERLQFFVHAADLDGDVTTLHCQNLPAHASLIPGQSGYWQFTFDPDPSQVGFYDLQFVALSMTRADTAVVRVEVFDNSNTVTIAPIPPQEVTEGDSLVIAISAVSSRIAPIKISAEKLGALDFQRFTDFGNGHAELVVQPRFTHSGEYSFRVIAWDYYDADTAMIDVTVLEAGDQPPRFAASTMHFYGAAGSEHTFDIDVDDPDGETVNCVAFGLPDFVTLALITNRWKLTVVSDDHDIGEYYFTVQAVDADNPALVATSEITLTMHALQQNSGPLIPAAIGNYWVYRHVSTSGYHYGQSGRPDYSVSSERIDSVEIIDSTRSQGRLVWLFSDGSRMSLDSDTLFYQSTSSATPMIYYPRAGYSYLGFVCSKLSAPIVLPAGAFANAFEFDNGSSWMTSPRAGKCFAPGIGEIKSYYSDYPQSPMSEDDDFSWHSSTSTLIRYRVR